MGVQLKQLNYIVSLSEGWRPLVEHLTIGLSIVDEDGKESVDSVSEKSIRSPGCQLVVQNKLLSFSS